jgi:hypothetical protein
MSNELLALETMAVRLALKGDAAYAYELLRGLKLPVPALVEREATGVDKEQEVKP